MIAKVKEYIFKGFGADTDIRRRLALIYLFVPFPVVIICIAFLLSLKDPEGVLFSILLFVYFLAIVSVIPLLRLTKNISLAENFLIFLAIPVQLSRLILGGEPKAALYLIIPWAVFAFFLTGRRMGLFWVGMLMGASLLLAFMGQAGAITVGYTVTELVQIYVFLLITVAILFLYDRRREFFQRVAQEEKEKAEQEQTRLSLLLESANDGVLAIDREWNVTLWNKAIAGITGWPTKAVLGKPLRKFLRIIDEKGRVEDIAFIEDAMVKGVPRGMRGARILITKDGSEVAVADSAAPIMDGQGHVDGAIVVLQDISDAKKLDVTKSELITIMAHQIRTPLSIIEWYTELVKQSGAHLTNQQQGYLNEIEGATKRASDLVKELLSAAKAEMGMVTINSLPVDFLRIWQDTRDDFRPLLVQKKITLHEKNDELPLVTADENLLQLAYRVLVSNAVKYTPSGGRISVTHTIDKVNHEVVIAVSDTGSGIAPEDKEKIFSKLFRSKAAISADPEGFGLALFTLKKVIEASGGRIWFESPAAKKGAKQYPGVTFFVAFPLGGMREKSKNMV